MHFFWYTKGVLLYHVCTVERGGEERRATWLPHVNLQIAVQPMAYIRCVLFSFPPFLSPKLYFAEIKKDTNHTYHA